MKYQNRLGVIPVFVLFVVVISGLFYGFFTPSGSAAFGALLIMIDMNKFTWKRLMDAIEGSIRSTTMVLFLGVGAVVLAVLSRQQDFHLSLLNSSAG